MSFLTVARCCYADKNTKSSSWGWMCFETAKSNTKLHDILKMCLNNIVKIYSNEKKTLSDTSKILLNPNVIRYMPKKFLVCVLERLAV